MGNDQAFFFGSDCGTHRLTGETKAVSTRSELLVGIGTFKVVVITQLGINYIGIKLARLMRSCNNLDPL